MTTTDPREEIERVLDIIMRNGDGEVFADDINAVMANLHIAPQWSERVGTTLEEIVYNRKAADAYRNDPVHASWNFSDHGRVNPDMVDSVIESHEREATQRVNLLVTLAAMSA